MAAGAVLCRWVVLGWRCTDSCAVAMCERPFEAYLAPVAHATCSCRHAACFPPAVCLHRHAAPTAAAVDQTQLLPPPHPVCWDGISEAHWSVLPQMQRLGPDLLRVAPVADLCISAAVAAASLVRTALVCCVLALQRSGTARWSTAARCQQAP
jgi:hypothetical protein